MTNSQTYFRRGLGLKKEIEPVLAAEYHSNLVEDIRARGYTATFGDVTLRLARDFGFCYGVDRAVDYAYQATFKFPDRASSCSARSSTTGTSTTGAGVRRGVPVPDRRRRFDSTVGPTTRILRVRVPSRFDGAESVLRSSTSVG